MRDISHRAAAAMAIGLLTDDLYGTLLDAPTDTRQAPQRTGFVDRAAADRWLADDPAAGPARPQRPRVFTVN